MFYLLCTEDSDGCDVKDSRAFFTMADAYEYAKSIESEHLPEGCALVLYECREYDVLREG